jgi:hypothetical protein
MLVGAGGRSALCCSIIDGDHAALQQEDEGTEKRYSEIKAVKRRVLVLRPPTHHIILQVFFSLPGRSILIGLP